MEQNGAPAAGQQPISDEMQFMGDLMILQVLADSEQVNDQEREVLYRWIEKAQLPAAAAAACAEPTAWLHEFTDPHTGERRSEARKNKPRDYEMLPGEIVTPLYASLPPPAEMSDEQIEAFLPKVRHRPGMVGATLYAFGDVAAAVRAATSASCAPKQTEGDGNAS